VTTPQTNCTLTSTKENEELEALNVEVPLGAHDDPSYHG
jgi:hypothetical protein